MTLVPGKLPFVTLFLGQRIQIRFMETSGAFTTNLRKHANQSGYNGRVVTAEATAIYWPRLRLWFPKELPIALEVFAAEASTA